MRINAWIVIGAVALIVIISGAYAVMKINGGAPSVDGQTGQQAMKEENEPAAEAMMESVATGSDAMIAIEGAAATSDAAGKIDAMMPAGSYVAYAAERAMLAAANRSVVLFFRADWCPTCRALDSDIRAHLSDIPANLVILDVNYDDAAALKRKYGVTYQHTFVQIDQDGNLIKKWSGSPTLAALVKEVK